MGVADQLLIESQREADRVVVRLEGELDMANASLLQTALEHAETDKASILVLDLQQLRFMDSTGLRVILGARERCQSSGQEFALTPGSKQVQRLLAISGVGQHLRIIAAPDELLV
jgi:anti-anti-sigma factor